MEKLKATNKEEATALFMDVLTEFLGYTPKLKERRSRDGEYIVAFDEPHDTEESMTLKDIRGSKILSRKVVNAWLEIKVYEGVSYTVDLVVERDQYYRMKRRELFEMNVNPRTSEIEIVERER